MSEKDIDIEQEIEDNAESEMLNEAAEKEIEILGLVKSPPGTVLVY